ncbi:hypothetical protein M0812_22619 [Anaeramoeba flamelloides]|uniref:Uncharacterized protein n=1 Tax=Anaeramoeba flamelloides TaxID=1746091 RepID=A0AAV7YXX1_9EUKA|nr:hypothetical protein M0812_22619 [Anaeramoeba flamelloides]
MKNKSTLLNTPPLPNKSTLINQTNFEELQKEFRSFKTFRDRFKNMVKLRPECFVGFSDWMLDKNCKFDGKHKTPTKIMIRKDCINDLSILTDKSKRTIERGINIFFTKKLKLTNCSFYSRDWLIYKIPDVEELERVQLRSRKRNRAIKALNSGNLKKKKITPQIRKKNTIKNKKNKKKKKKFTKIITKYQTVKVLQNPKKMPRKVSTNNRLSQNTKSLNLMNNQTESTGTLEGQNQIDNHQKDLNQRSQPVKNFQSLHDPGNHLDTRKKQEHGSCYKQEENGPNDKIIGKDNLNRLEFLIQQMKKPSSPLRQLGSCLPNERSQNKNPIIDIEVEQKRDEIKKEMNIEKEVNTNPFSKGSIAQSNQTLLQSLRKDTQSPPNRNDFGTGIILIDLYPQTANFNDSWLTQFENEFCLEC